MEFEVKIMTHETIVHTQLNSIEKLLNRDIDYKANLNTKGIRSSISFKASQLEIDLVKNDLGYKIFIKNNDHWILA